MTKRSLWLCMLTTQSIHTEAQHVRTPIRGADFSSFLLQKEASCIVLRLRIRTFLNLVVQFFPPLTDPTLLLICFDHLSKELISVFFSSSFVLICCCKHFWGSNILFFNMYFSIYSFFSIYAIYLAAFLTHCI